MKRFFNCCFVVLAISLLAAPAFAANGLIAKVTKGFNTEFEVKLTDVNLSKVDVLGRQAVSLDVPGSHLTLNKNAPELAYLTALVMIDPTRSPVINVKRIQAEIISLDAPVVPSKGNITRDIDPVSVPYVYGEVYNQDRWYPSDDELVNVSEPFIFRNVRGVRLLIHPIQYNPVQNKLRVHRSLKISVNSGSVDSRNVIRAPLAISRFFEPMYRNAFINFDGAAQRLPRLDENGRLLIVCHDAFVDAIQPFVAWKIKCGLAVVLAKTSETGKTANEIKAFIQQEYDKGGLTHVMLVGDAAQVPTLKGVKENADSDPCYTKLAGNDHVPDCIISRLSATTPEQVAYQVAKFVNYEQFPSAPADASWYTKGVGIASNQGNPTDFVRAGWLRDALLKAQYKSIDEIYDPSATKAKISAAVNEGRSLINYIGHGSNTSWGTTGFSNTEVGQLKNGWKLPLIWSVACVNGNFVNLECFCEAWMKAGDIENPRGAIAIFGASTNQEWVPPCDVQKEIITNYTVNELYKTAGGLAMNGIMKGLEIYGVEPKGSGVMMLEQWHLFGDGTLLVRFNEPKPVTATSEAVTSEGQSKVTVKVVDADGKPVANARVNVYTSRFEIRAGSRTNDAGEAVVTIAADKTTEGYLTVVGSNLIPVVDQKISF